MAQLIETFDLTAILQPVQYPELARWTAVTLGPNQTLTRGTFLGQKTADMKMYPLNTGGADGTQNGKGILMYSCVTDANGLIYLGPNAVSGARIGPWHTIPMFRCGVFDPYELQTAATPVAQVDTDTPATVAIGNVFTLTATEPDGTTLALSYTAQAATAADVVTGLTNLVNAATDAVFSSVMPSGTNTLILTSKYPGQTFSIAPSATGGTATFTRAATTAASGAAIGDITAHGFPAARVLENGYWWVF